MSLQLKPGVDIGGVAPEMVFGGMIVASVYEAFGYRPCRVTSGRDGEHKKGSLHYVGRALDFGFWNVPQSERANFAAAIRAALGEDFDVVMEENHYHVEFDPKPKAVKV